MPRRSETGSKFSSESQNSSTKTSHRFEARVQRDDCRWGDERDVGGWGRCGGVPDCAGVREGDSPRVRLIGLLETRYPKAVRAAVLRVMEGEAVTAAEMSRLNWRLGEIYADCVEKAAEKFGVRVGLVGCHGQTVQHETRGCGPGRTVRSTWQMGEAAVVAERMRCPVVSDFRPADVAAGGRGRATGADAGLVPVSVGEGEPRAAEPGWDCESDGDSGGGGAGCG